MDNKLLTLPVAFLAIMLIACGGKSDGGSSGEAQNVPEPAVTTTSASPPAPVKTTGRPGAGSLRTSLRDTSGTERVNCSNINTELRIIADFGWIEWTAVAVSKEPTFNSPDIRADSVTVTASSGKLEKDQSVVVKIRGTYSGTNKTFWIRAQEDSGGSSSMNAVKFSC